MPQLKTSLYFLIFASIFSQIATAEIYKYKDEQGKWHFSDKAPESEGLNVERISRRNTATDSQIPEDITAYLQAKFPTKTPLEKTTLAVVSIKSALGSGTGFFVSTNGYIVTNRHVVRPTTSSGWKENKAKFDKRSVRLTQEQQKLTSRAHDLKKMATNLSRYKKDIATYSGGQKNVAQSEYNIYKKRYKNLKKNYQKHKNIISETARKLNKQQSKFRSASYSSKLAKRFEIQLKDGTKRHARLIKLSKKQDLALLKLDKHTTPFIDISNSQRPSQGTKVFAIGSPLGLRDFVTAGIVTNIRKNHIITDTQILPGNSGGPLIDHKGRIIGVNTMKILSDQSSGSVGFGVAIPVKLVREQFGQLITQP